MSKSIARKISVMILCMITVCSIAIGMSSYVFFRNSTVESNAKRAEDLAQAVVALIDPDEFEDALDNMEENDHWYMVKAVLDEIKLQTGVKYLYVLDAKSDDNVTYYAEGYNSQTDFLDELILGAEESIEYYDEMMFEAIETGKSQISALYPSGEFGMMVSGFAPIMRGSVVVGVVGVDVSVNEVMQAANSFGLHIAVIIVGACVVFGLLGVYLVNRLFGNPIVQLAKASDRLAQGELDVELSSRRRDEVGLLANSFQRMVENSKNQVKLMEQIADGDLNVSPVIRSEQDAMNIAIEKTASKLNGMFRDILSSASQVSAAAEQISVTAQNLADSTNEQTNTVERFSEVVVQVHGQSEENTREALEGKNATRRAGEFMDGSMALMEGMTDAMEEINKSSQEISQIIKTIDDIAFQTNILALNAAVEAARAGQYGKGFAVVADEVRNLAAKSAEAAKETAALIERSVEKVGSGRSITDSTRASLLQVNEIAGKTAQAMERINAASYSQKLAIGEINAAVDQISVSVQSNSATAQQSAASAEELSAQAGMLKEVVSRFRLRREENSFALR